MALDPACPTVLVTGAGRGIGLELVTQYAARGWNVIATSRRGPEDEALLALAAARPQVVAERMDVRDTEGIRAVAARYDAHPIDVLVNNAAAVERTFAADLRKIDTPFEAIDFDDARTDFDVNAIGPMRVAQAFLPHVERSKQKKIVNVTSLAGSFGRPLGGSRAMTYGASKAALNKYSVVLAQALAPRGIVVALVQPLFVASKADRHNMKNAAPLDLEVGKLVALIDALSHEHSGRITNFQTGGVDPF